MPAMSYLIYLITMISIEDVHTHPNTKCNLWGKKDVIIWNLQTIIYIHDLRENKFKKWLYP